MTTTLLLRETHYVWVSMWGSSQILPDGTTVLKGKKKEGVTDTRVGWRDLLLGHGTQA